ncbi:MAG: bifunctional diguanylate cyclase/phosphodiesterase [Rhodoblastus sp.]|nr:MAG: bifunctional diguanylate cyclase/phosphodiesterase [Rhodoblastus sp.]
MTVNQGERQANRSPKRDSIACAAGAAAICVGATALSVAALGATASSFALVAAPLAAAALAFGVSARRMAARDAALRLDPLTGLPGRMEFREELERRIAATDPGCDALTVMNVNLRRLREVNENFGHEAGDAILLAMRERLTKLSPPGSFLARVGGDEFAAILPSLTVAQRDRLASAIADSMCHAPDAPDILTVQVMVGLASCERGGASHVAARELLRRADVALSQGKAHNTPVTVYTDKLSDELKSKKQLEDDLRQALAQGKLHVNYQPLFAIDGVTLVGAETLVRWIHPTLGSIAPPVFVGLAEERGLMDQLGEFVLRRACLDARSWPSHLFVAVNVSPLQFRKDSFLDDVARILDETGLPAPPRIGLTETAVVADEAKAEDMIIELRARGVRMALDDFGTGYSSLIYLRRFAFDKIKIDRSFLEALEPSGESAIIVESMVHLGRSLGLTVTAEGIETPEQHRFLQGVGCHELQGYLFSRPLPLTPSKSFSTTADRVQSRSVRSPERAAL